MSENPQEFVSKAREQLGILRELETMTQALMQREANRLRRKYGTDDPRTRRIEKRAASGYDALRKLENEQAAEPPADVATPAPDEYVVYGRAFDRRKTGVAGLVVVLEDAKGAAARGIKAVTDAEGHYALNLDPGTAKRLAKKEYFVTVRDRKNNVLFRTGAPLAIRPGIAERVDVSLARQRGHTIRAEEKTEPSPRRKGNTYTMRGRVSGAEGKPVAGVLVRVYASEERHADLLGAAMTKRDGTFSIRYAHPGIEEGGEPVAALHLVVVDASENVLHKTTIRHDPAEDREFEVKLGKQR